MGGSAFDEFKVHHYESTVDRDPMQVPASSESDLASYLGRMSLDDGGGFVPVSVGGETFYAHPAVLAARSPFLKDQLSMGMGGGITLSGIEPETFRVVLQFMHADTLPGELTTESLHRLLAAADVFGMDGLKITCTEKLMERVSPETVADTLCCAEVHHCPELKKRCIDYCFSPEVDFLVVGMSDGYRQIAVCCPWIVGELRREFALRQAMGKMDFLNR